MKERGRRPQEVVALGYDRIAERYAEWAASFWTPALNWVEDLLERLPPQSRILDLGCGSGRPFTQRLAVLHDVTGVDISKRQIELARANVPGARFVHGDAASVEVEGSFDAVVSLFMLGHVPRAEQGALLGRIGGWLRPGGLALFTMATGGSADAVEPDWLGAPMFFASFESEENRELVRHAGLEILAERVVPQNEPGHGTISFLWVLARTPSP